MKNFKKIFLSLGVVALFLAYAIYQRFGSSQSSEASPAITSKSAYKDGEYSGNNADAIYGNLRVKAIINGGKIADVQFLDYPNDRETSIRINTKAMPILTKEAIMVQNAKVDIVSGATQTSEAFRESLASALERAKI